MKWNTDKLSESLGLRPIGVIDAPEGGRNDHWGGWESVNSSEFSDEWKKMGGEARSKTLAAHNKSQLMRSTTAARNKKYSVGNKFRLGINHSEEARKKISENNGSRGSKWMLRGDVSKKVPKDQVDDHLSDGWQFGRTMR